MKTIRIQADETGMPLMRPPLIGETYILCAGEEDAVIGVARTESSRVIAESVPCFIVAPTITRGPRKPKPADDAE